MLLNERFCRCSPGGAEGEVLEEDGEEKVELLSCQALPQAHPLPNTKGQESQHVSEDSK